MHVTLTGPIVCSAQETLVFSQHSLTALANTAHKHNHGKIFKLLLFPLFAVAKTLVEEMLLNRKAVELAVNGESFFLKLRSRVLVVLAVSPSSRIILSLSHVTRIRPGCCECL
jgi:hypothetical protein